MKRSYFSDGKLETAFNLNDVRYKKHAIYCVTRSSFISDAYICRGVAIDEEQDVLRDKYALICSTYLYTKVDGEISVESNAKSVSVVGLLAVDSYGHLIGIIYVSIDVYHEIGVKVTSWEMNNSSCAQVIYHTVQLNTQKYEAVGPIYNVMFSKSDDGRYCTRINVHPEKDGQNAVGKVFFPDRSWDPTTVFCGWAQVKVAREYENYGFLTGEMIKPQVASRDAIYEYLMDNSWDGLQHIKKICSDFYGEFYAIDFGGYNNLYFITYGSKAGTIEKTMQCGLDIIKSGDCTVEWSGNVNEFVFDYRFEEEGHTYSDLQSMLRPCDMNDLINTRWRWRLNWVASAASVKDELLQDALDLGILQHFTLNGFNSVRCLQINNYKLYKFTQFSWEEIEDICTAVVAYNTEAKERIKSLIRKGSLRIAN